MIGSFISYFKISLAWGSLRKLSMDTLERIMISSNQLTHLHVYKCSGLNTINVDAPNLLSFDFVHNPIPIISTNAPCPSNVYFSNLGDVDTRWYLNLMEFLGAFNQIGNLSLSLNYNQTSSEAVTLHSLFKLRVWNYLSNLSAFIWKWYHRSMKFCWMAFFGFFIPKNLCLSPGNWRYRPFVTWFYDHLRNRSTSCCNDRQIKCWGLT